MPVEIHLKRLRTKPTDTVEVLEQHAQGALDKDVSIDFDRKSLTVTAPFWPSTAA